MQVERPSSALRRVLRDERRPIVVSAVCGVAHQTCEILVPVVIGIVVDRAIEPSDGLETVVGIGGHPLDPAQAQQLALARLVLRDPGVAVLDEATAEAAAPAHGPSRTRPPRRSPTARRSSSRTASRRPERRTASS